MCYILHIANEFTACGHQVVFRRQRIDCNSNACVLSNQHRIGHHDCHSTCRQSLMREQTWTSGRLLRPCDACYRSGNFSTPA
ncbi:hypothetical protein EV361DRAFT_911105 [Lentinula raphanica]|uniref:Uncharacterized protein n=1 Tax=Lentinula raphanica TaxID=153919 RepID=A0AA38UEJ1_9AGAR|nr:hypothetical protein C8R42DRAFT_674898 [Lentinula raphanica]KAJ3777679.1 hypothetical protein FB446DRAFT_716595 [Lentinula raphanica]KAJ3827252.1 hypothetical protein F5880DRAFT_1267338 [Lentinula raphanica]KAJ3838155.1 hypothetical protein F5878DRAFT_620236 [Lentinula raphanica]KAJ3971490.1 hypothetical protein EV361DRAFT_911105 [Lentinula raphanica]